MPPSVTTDSSELSAKLDERSLLASWLGKRKSLREKAGCGRVEAQNTKLVRDKDRERERKDSFSVFILLAGSLANWSARKGDQSSRLQPDSDFVSLLMWLS